MRRKLTATKRLERTARRAAERATKERRHDETQAYLEEGAKRVKTRQLLDKAMRAGQPRGVDRVPERYRVTLPEAEVLVAHEHPNYRARRASEKTWGRWTPGKNIPARTEIRSGK